MQVTEEQEGRLRLDRGWVSERAASGKVGPRDAATSQLTLTLRHDLTHNIYTSRSMIVSVLLAIQ